MKIADLSIIIILAKNFQAQTYSDGNIKITKDGDLIIVKWTNSYWVVEEETAICNREKIIIFRIMFVTSVKLIATQQIIFNFANLILLMIDFQ